MAFLVLIFSYQRFNAKAVSYSLVHQRFQDVLKQNLSVTDSVEMLHDKKESRASLWRFLELLPILFYKSVLFV